MEHRNDIEGTAIVKRYNLNAAGGIHERDALDGNFVVGPAARRGQSWDNEVIVDR